MGSSADAASTEATMGPGEASLTQALARQDSGHGEGGTKEREEAERAIRTLSAARRYEPRKNPTPSERLIRRWEGNMALGACVAVSLAILLVTMPSASQQTEFPEIRRFAMAMVGVSAACALAFLFLEPVVLVFRVGRKMDDSAHHSLGSYRHERRIVDELAACSATALNSVDHWLATRVAGIEGRVGVFFGEKVSAIALIAVLATFGRSLTDAQSAGTGHGSAWFAGCVVAVAAGAVAAAVGLRIVSASFTYQKQLLAEALGIAERRNKQSFPVDPGLA